MILHGELAVGALDLYLRRRAADSQHFVIVALPVAGQNDLPSGWLILGWSYDLEFRATLTIDGRTSRSLNL
jgi:hypothetical protein